MLTSTNTIRKILRKTFGIRNYRLTREGLIYIYDRLPNTNETGWYFWGYVGDENTQYRLDQLCLHLPE